MKRKVIYIFKVNGMLQMQGKESGERQKNGMSGVTIYGVDYMNKECVVQIFLVIGIA